MIEYIKNLFKQEKNEVSKNKYRISTETKKYDVGKVTVEIKCEGEMYKIIHEGKIRQYYANANLKTGFKLYLSVKNELTNFYCSDIVLVDDDSILKQYYCKDFLVVKKSGTSIGTVNNCFNTSVVIRKEQIHSITAIREQKIEECLESKLEEIT